MTGISTIIGGSVDLGLSGGVEAMFDKNGPLGIQLNIGFGVSGAEIHGLRCVTALIPFGKNFRASRSEINRVMTSIRSMISRSYA